MFFGRTVIWSPTVVRRNRLGSLLKAILLLGCLSTVTAPVAADEILDQARSLMGAGKADEAYQFLVPYHTERAGDPIYDYLLGIAALDSGRHLDAVFALERVVAVDPENAQARAELARAHFELKELRISKEEFEKVREQRPPSEVRATIQRYLDEISRLEPALARKLRGYLALSFGYDTNVNSAQGSEEVAIPLFAGFGRARISDDGVEKSDTFGKIAGGFTFESRVSDRVTFSLAGNVHQRRNNDERIFDAGGGNASAGLSVSHGQNVYSVALQGDKFLVDRDTFRNAYGVVGKWRRTLDPVSQVSAFVQGTRLKYPAQRIRDADRVVGGVAYARILPGKYAPVVYAGAYVGREDERAEGVDHLGHELLGARLGGEIKVNEETSAFLSLSGERRDYGGTDPFFLVGREDRRFDGRVGVRYTPARHWSITPELTYTHNDSNVALNEFDRTQVFVAIRRELE